MFSQTYCFCQFSSIYTCRTIYVTLNPFCFRDRIEWNRNPYFKTIILLSLFFPTINVQQYFLCCSTFVNTLKDGLLFRKWSCWWAKLENLAWKFVRCQVSDLFECCAMERSNSTFYFVSVHKNAKRELGQYPAILTSRLVNNIYIFLWSNLG